MCLASLKASVVLVSHCLQAVVVAVIVDWVGLTVCCLIYWFLHGWRHLRKGCWSRCVENDLLHTGVYLLWLWELWIVISAWWLWWPCWHNPTVLFRSSISVWLPLCRWVIFLISLIFKSIRILFLAMCSFQFNPQSKCNTKYFTAFVWGLIVWLMSAGQWPSEG